MAKKSSSEVIAISPPKFETLEFQLIGTAPYMQLRFSEKAKNKMKGIMESGGTAKGKKGRPSRDFDQDCLDAMYVSAEGWNGIPASCFRNAMISACRTVGFKMTLAKLSVFVEADGFDSLDGTPLIKLDGAWERTDMAVRNANGKADIRIRPMWRDWSARLRVRFDADQFTKEDVANLVARVGMQVGIGEGRPDSKSSAGLGLGLFRLG